MLVSRALLPSKKISSVVVRGAGRGGGSRRGRDDRRGGDLLLDDGLGGRRDDDRRRGRRRPRGVGDADDAAERVRVDAVVDQHVEVGVEGDRDAPRGALSEPEAGAGDELRPVRLAEVAAVDDVVVDFTDQVDERDRDLRAEAEPQEVARPDVVVPDARQPVGHHAGEHPLRNRAAPLPVGPRPTESAGCRRRRSSTDPLPTGMWPASQKPKRRSGSFSEEKWIFVPSRIFEPSVTLKSLATGMPLMVPPCQSPPLLVASPPPATKIDHQLVSPRPIEAAPP